MARKAKTTPPTQDRTPAESPETTGADTADTAAGADATPVEAPPEQVAVSGEPAGDPMSEAAGLATETPEPDSAG